MSPAFVALSICLAAAALEGILAGKGVRARLAELRHPRFSPPLAVWLLIGGAYYVVCFAILFRLIASDLPSPSHKAAVVVLLMLMVANAAWGFLFFRVRNLRASFLAFIPYGLLALLLAALLATIDLTCVMLLAPYLAYLGYAIWWAHSLWLLNRS